MTAPGPVFFNLNDPFHQGIEPAWKRCWLGHEKLWKVFWGWCLCGHGVILGCSVGFMMITMILGFATDPGSLNAGFAGMATGMAILVIVFVPYSIWCSVSLWRCANNCINKIWGYAARLLVICYAISTAFLISKFFT